MVLLPFGGVRLALCSGRTAKARVALEFCKSRRLDSQKRFAAFGSDSLRKKLAFLAGRQHASL